MGYKTEATDEQTRKPNAVTCIDTGSTMVVTSGRGGEDVEDGKGN